MLEKDQSKRFDINEVDSEIKRINFVVDKVNNKQELEKKLVVKESVVKSVTDEDYTFNNRYIMVRKISQDSFGVGFLVHDMHDNHNKFVEK